ncbi:MAG: CARDB domain-containing protein [Pseudomarimonas sp.]
MKVDWPSVCMAALLGCVLSATATAETAIATLNLHDDVEELDLTRLGPKGSTSAATFVADLDNVSVFTLTGAYERGLAQPRFDLASAFHATHADRYDFLIVFTSFEFGTGDAMAFYNPVLNDIEGIGMPRFDHRDLYGGARRLQGFIDMAALSRYQFSSLDPQYRNVLNTLAHEIMHRWSMRLRYRAVNGDLSADLIGRESAHWSLGTSSDASIMLGAKWQEQTPGNWLVTEARQRFGTWDMYLAGLAAADELAPIPLIRSADIDPLAVPTVGMTARGFADNILPTQVIAAEGSRLPSATHAQREFDAAIVLVLRPGEVVDPQDLAKLERLRVAFESYFQSITRGRAVIRLHLQPASATNTGLPTTLSGSAGPPPTQPIAAATQWLISGQLADGHWQDHPATAARDTSVAANFIAELGSANAAASAARAWLSARQPTTNDERAWLQAGVPERQFTSAVTRNPDGGVGLVAAWLSSPLDTLRGLLGAVAAIQRDEPAIAAFSGYLIGEQNDDGSFAPTVGGRGRISPSVAAVSRLLQGGSEAERVAGAIGRDWLHTAITAQAISNGDFSLAEIAELALHAPALQFQPSIRFALVDRLRSQQGQAGDWGGSVYITALSALALERESRPNLVAVTASVQPTLATQGDWLQLRIRVANRGGQPAPTTLIRWSHGAPSTVLAEAELPPLLPNDERIIDTWVRNESLVGELVLRVEVDAAAAVAEGREDDNVTTVAVVIAAPGSAPDLGLHPRDISFAPSHITQVPSVIRLTGLLRNAGLAPAGQVVLRAVHVLDSGQAPTLAEVVVDVAATGQTAFALDLPITLAQAHQVRLLADPENLIAESRETNNIVEVNVPFGNAVDLELPDAAPLVTPAQPVLGEDIRFRTVVANRGTSDSPPASLVLEQEVNGEWLPRAATTVAVAAAQQVERELSWRPLTDGTLALRLRVDAENLISETNEDNNRLDFVLQLGRNDGPELALLPGSISTTPAQVLQGAPVQVSGTVRNLGQSAANAFTVALYRGDPRSGGVRIGATRIDAGLAALAETVVRIDVADYAESGDAALYLFADSELEIAERSESDNMGLRDITALRLPNLSTALGAISLTPSAPVFGQPVSTRITVSNTGEQGSAAVVVRLSELAGAARAEVEPAVTLAALAPGASTDAVFAWTFGLIEATQALSVEIDPDNQVREFNELDNELTVLLDTQSGDAFATELYFSPNGDGVKDQTRVVWRQTAASEKVEVQDHSGRVVRFFNALENVGNGAGAVVWDGRDDGGQLVTDGQYTLFLRHGTGQISQPVRVTLDTDQPMALEAVNTDHGVTRNLPSGGQWLAAPEGSAIDDYLYHVGGIVVRFHALTGQIEPVVTERWFDSYGQQHNTSATPSQLLMLDDGRVLLAVRVRANVGGAVHTELFTLDANAVDSPVPLAQVPTSSNEPLLGQFDARRVLVGGREAGADRFVVDIETGSVTAMRTNASSGELELVNSLGVVLKTNSPTFLDFVPVDPGQPISQLGFPNHSDGTRALRVAFSEDGLHYLTHVQRFDVGIPGAEESVSVVDVRTGISRELIRVDVPYAGETLRNDRKRLASESGEWRNLRMLRAYWLEHQAELVVIDLGQKLVLRFAADGSPLGEMALPALLREQAYAAHLSEPGFPIQQIFSADAANPNVDCRRSAHPVWLEDATSLHGFERQVFDSHTGALYLTTGEVVYAGQPDIAIPTARVCEGAVDYLRLERDGTAERIGGSTVWPLQSQFDVSIYPSLQQVGGATLPPPTWPAFIHRNGTILQRDGRVSIPSQGRVTLPWSASARLRDSSAGQSRLQLAASGAPASDQNIVAVFSTIEKLSAVLSAGSDGRTIQLSGLVADRNFDHYSIDWALASTPDAWNVLVPATRDEVLFDDFVGWAPPLPGAYVLRLRAADRAGNVRERFASAAVEIGSPLTDVRQDLRDFSPNGDGVQDAVTLTFKVVRATEQRFSVRDAAGVVVRQEDRLYGAAEIGPNSWTWDGLTTAGSPAAEGRYRIELSSGHTLRVNLDLTAPSVTAELPLPWAQPPFLLDLPYVDYQVDFGNPAVASPKRSVQLQSAALDSADWSELLPVRLYEFVNGRSEAQLSGMQYHNRRFRVVAVDVAGNRSVQDAGASQPTLLFAGAANSGAGDRLQPPPYGTRVGIPVISRTFFPSTELVPILVPAVRTSLVALDLADGLSELIVDELLSASGGGDPIWTTLFVAAPEQIETVVSSGHWRGHVKRIPFDLSERLPGSRVTLRLRARYAGGAERVANAMTLTIGSPAGGGGGGGGGGVSGGGEGSPGLQVVPALSQQCDSTPSGRVHIIVKNRKPDRAYRVAVRSPFLTLPVELSVPNEAPFEHDLDVSGWPEADYRGVLEERAVDGSEWQAVADAPFFVDRSIPEVQIESPAPGARMCGLTDEPHRLLATIEDDRNFGFFVEKRMAGSEQPFLRVPIGASTGVACTVGADCDFETGRVRGFSLSDVHNFEAPLPLPTSTEALEVRVRASDWSGAQVCKAVNYSVDSRAELEERSSPLPLPPPSTINMPGISPGSSGAYREARWFLLTREPVSLEVSLFRAQRTNSNSQPQPIGDALATLASVARTLGEYDFIWNGRIAGVAAADGLYVVRFVARDDCGNEATLDRPVTVDASAPEVDLVQPTAGAQLRVATLQVRGTAVDPHFASLTVEVSQGSSAGPWQTIGDHLRPFPTPALLAEWNTGGAVGPTWIRVTALDWLGNGREIVSAIELLPRPLLLTSARALPALFSPNADGVKDSVSVQLQLGTAAQLTVVVIDAAGSVVRRLAESTSVTSGPVVHVWDGRREDGNPASDGEYTIRINAIDAADPNRNDEQRLTVTIDTVAPRLSAVTPSSSLANCDASASFELFDLFPASFTAQLQRGNSLIAERSGNTNGLHEITLLAGLAESSYRLTIETSDLAGNVTAAEHDFELDCTPPVAEIAAPLASAVVARATGRVLAISGTASDTHLQRYVLQIAAVTDPENRTTLFESTQAVVAGELYAWTPTQADGDYLLTLKVTDGAGNGSDAVTPIRIDGTPPIARIDQPLEGALVREHLFVSGTASDDHFARARIQFATPAQAALGQWSTVSELPFATTDGQLASLQLSHQGELRLRLWVEDLAGLEAFSVIPLVVDGQPPPAPQTLTAVAEDNLNVRLAWQGAEVTDLRDFQIQRNGAEVGRSTTRSFLDRLVPEAELTYTVIAFDNAGNASEPSNPVSVLIDRTPPAVALFAPSEGETLRGNYAVRGRAHSAADFDEYVLSLRAVDGSELQVLRRSATAVDGGLLHSWDTRGIAEGSALRLRLSARDSSGNQAQVERAVTIDNAPPAAPTGLQLQDAGADVVATWAPNTEPDLLGYLLYRGGQLVGYGSNLPPDLRPLTTPQNTLTDGGAPDGELIYRVYAMDRAGNLSPPSDPANLTRNVGPPRLEFLRPQAGESFSASIEAVARSDDRDIATVEFAARPIASSTWTPFGGVLTALPWRATFTPAAAEYGEYELRAIATDVGGQQTAVPPLVRVRYVDLTPPPTPQNLRARAAGASVALSWDASVAADLAGYRVERQGSAGQWELVQTALLTQTIAIDLARPEGAHSYRVIAFDESENASPTSNVDTAHVFGLLLAPAYTPIAEPSVDVRGRSGERGGTLHYRVLGEGGVLLTEGTGAIIQANSDFVLPALPLAVGRNAIEVRVTDAEGNRSLMAATAVRRGQRPLPPTGLQGSVQALAVSLTWLASPSADVLGYRVYRNDRAITLDPNLGQVITATSAVGASAALAVDGDLATAWTVDAPPSSAELGSAGVLELRWDNLSLISGLRLQFASAGAAANVYRVNVLSEDGHWIAMGERSDQSSASALFLAHTAYPTRGLRIELVRAQQPGAQLRLLEVQPLQHWTTAMLLASEPVSEGQHVYTVTAVSPLGFESERSNAWTAAVGDVDPPPAVILSGALENGVPVLSWTESAAADLAGYVLKRDGQTLAHISYSAPRRHEDSAAPNGEHTYVVLAEDIHGNTSAPSNQVVLTVTLDGPGQPSISQVQQPGLDLALRVTWLAGAGPPPTAYRLEVGNQMAGPYTLLLTLSASDYLHSGLETGRSYFYRVAAVASNGSLSAYSVPVSGAVLDRIPPLAPQLTYPTVPGRTIQWADARFDVCGMGSPAARTTITMAGDAITTVNADATWSHRLFELAALGSDAVLSDDGRALMLGSAATDGLPGWFSLSSGQRISAAPAAGGAWRLLLRLADGRSVIGANTAGELAIAHRDLDVIEPRGAFVGVLDDLAVDAAADRIYVIGDQAGQGHGLWMATDATQPFVSIALPANRRAKAGSLHWQAEPASVVLADELGNAYRVDATTSTVTLIGNGADRAGPIPAPIGSDWLSVDASGRLLRHTSGASAPQVLLADSRILLALAWSADASQIALLFADGIERRRADTGVLLDRIERVAEAGSGTHRLQWSPSWQLLSTTADPTLPVLSGPPGAFCARDLSSVPGLQIVQAVARNRSDLPGPASLPIRIEFEPAPPGSVDLLLHTDELHLFPEGARIGDQQVAYVSLHTIGDGSVELPNQRALKATLERPDGTVDLTISNNTLVLSGGFSNSFAIDLGRATVVGEYRLTVIADPEQRVEESDENNNRISRSWNVGIQPQPQLALAPDQSVWAPGAAIRGRVEVSNPGELFQGEIALRALDAAGNDQGEIARYTLPSLATGQTRRFDWSWQPGALANGGYVIQATLFAANGSVLLTRRADIVIEAQVELRLHLLPASLSATAGNALPVEIGIDYLAGNLLLDDGQLRLLAQAQDGTSQTLWQGGTGLLLPGYSVRRNLVWPGTAQAPGTYQLRLEFVAGEHQRSTNRDVVLVAAGAGATLSGRLQLTPAATVVLGGPVASLHVGVSNSGMASLAGVDVRVQVRAQQATSQLLEQIFNVDIANGATIERSVALSALPEQIQNYVATLQARRQGDPADSWQTLAALGFSATDGLAPSISVISPASGAPHRAPAPLAVRISDRHSNVERASYRVDGGEWQPLSVGGADGYQALLHGLADGAHRVEVRAFDGWDNEARSAVHEFVVDSTPPTIQIDGVTDGELRNQPAVATITVTDAHPDQTRIWLDDVPYVSATPINTEGAHLLRVIATDLAGNRAQREARFTIDLSAPALSFASPTDGSQTSADAVAVAVDSEPAARIELSVGSFVAQLDTDAAGRAVFASVPLSLGANVLRATATDRANNTSPAATVTVTRTLQPGALSGQIVPALLLLPLGENLPVTVTVRNDTQQTLDSLSLRLRALDANNVTLTELTFSTSLAAGAEAQWQRELLSADWALGAVRLVLDTDLGQGLLVLDEVGIQVIDAAAPSLQPLAPAAASVQPRPTQLTVAITDNHSIISAEYRLDSEAWSPLLLIAGSIYGAAISVADGNYSLQFRAADAAGNVGQSMPLTFAVDGTPPQITVSGVADGEIYSQPVAAIIGVLDAFPDSLEIRLNGTAYVSGTPITVSGKYLLEVAAEDVVGNRSLRELRFQLDREPPSVTFIEPAADSIIASDRVLVLGTTEPAASVRLSTATFEATVVADVSGGFSVSDVPLLAGANLLSARATDPAGNIGAVSTLRVFHSPGNPIGLGGSITAVPRTVAAGASFGLKMRIHELAGAARAALPMRIRLRTVGSTEPFLVINRHVALAAGQTVSLIETLDSTPFALGNHVAHLDVQVDGNWHELASDLLQIVDLTAPTVSILQPVANSLYATTVAVRAQVSDASGVATVEIRIEGDAWQAMVADGAGQWQRALTLPWEGALLLQVRATDTAGNQSDAAAVTIRADQSPPVIRVTGVTPGMRASTAVAAVITIEDASAFTSTITLDGSAYLSGTVITTAGEHALRVVAEDELGHRSTQQVNFSIEDAPIFIPTLRFGALLMVAFGLLLVALLRLRRQGSAQ